MPTNPGKAGAAQGFGALVGRALMSAIFIWAGYAKLVTAAGTVELFRKTGLPLPELAWLIAVIVELGGGLALLLGLQARLAALVLAGWCIVTALVEHSNFADADSQIHFMKNVAMTGGLLFVVVFGAGAFTLERVLFSRASQRSATSDRTSVTTAVS